LCVAESLAKIISAELPENLVGSSVEKLSTMKSNYARTALLDKNIIWSTSQTTASIESEKQRQEESAVAIAAQIWKDVKESVTDLLFVEFEIVLTGEAGKGVTKADIELVVTKKTTKEVITKIEASLKVYKSWNINLANSTFTSWIINLIDPSIGGFSSK